MKKKTLATILTLTLSAALLAGCGSSQSSSSSGSSSSAEAGSAASDSSAENTQSSTTEAGAAATQSSSGDKQDLVMDINVPDEQFNTDIINAVQAKFGDQYNLVIKTFSGTDEIQTVKTAAMADDQIDLVMYWPNSMNHFTEANLATPLDDYLTDEWKARFNEGALESGTYDGHIYNLPYSTVYPVIVVNTDLAEQAGVTLNEDGSWTWSEFEDFCDTVKNNTDAFGTCIPTGWATWLTRNSYLQCWDTDEEADKYASGDFSFYDDKIKNVTELVNNDFVNGMFYPGDEASLALSTDECKAALSSGKVASMFAVNSMVKQVLDDSGIENYKIMDWPNMGSNPSNFVLGGSNGYFIPTTSKNIDGAVAVLDYLTSTELADIRAEQGCVSTIKTDENASVDQELLSDISRRSSAIHHEATDLSSELGTYLETMPAAYYNNGDVVFDEMEDLLKEAVGE